MGCGVPFERVVSSSGLWRRRRHLSGGDDDFVPLPTTSSSFFLFPFISFRHFFSHSALRATPTFLFKERWSRRRAREEVVLRIHFSLPPFRRPHAICYMNFSGERKEGE